MIVVVLEFDELDPASDEVPGESVDRAVRHLREPNPNLHPRVHAAIAEDAERVMAVFAP